MPPYCRYQCVMALIIFLSVGPIMPPVLQAQGESDRFKNFEIRVIRPKFFIKTMNFEMSLQMGAIFNHAFIYTITGSGSGTFHLNEYLALEANGQWGLSLEREAKKSLKQEYQINTIISRTQHIVTGSMVWTPIYGKFQTFSQKLVYFDIFLSGGGGITGIDYQYDHCQRGAQTSQVLSKPKVVNYPTFFANIGTKVFLNKKTAIRADLAWLHYFDIPAHALCSVEDQKKALEKNEQVLESHVMLKVGISRFF